MRRFLVATAIVGAVGIPAQAQTGALELVTQDRILRADGRSQTVIRATVRDNRGAYVADGTRVIFTLAGTGRLDTFAALTRGGVATATLTSPNQPGSATVTANLENPGQVPPARITISYATEADLAEASGNWLRATATDYLGYSVGISGNTEPIIQAEGRKGGAVVEFRGLRVRADRLQLQLSPLGLAGIVVRASGSVTVERGTQKRTYDRLVLPLSSGAAGFGERVIGYRADPIALDPTTLAETPIAPDKRPPSTEWNFLEVNRVVRERVEVPLRDETGAPLVDETTGKPLTQVLELDREVIPPKLTVTAQSLALEPDNQVQFKRATIYLEGQKAFSLPYHVMGAGQQGIFRQQVLGLGPAGVVLDFPVYYDVRPTGVGTMHVRRGAQFGSSIYSVRPGWTLDLEQAYTGGRGMDGAFQLLGVSRPDFGMRLSHRQRIDDRTAASLYVDYPSRRALYGNLNLSRAFKDFLVTSLLTGSRGPTVRDNQTGRNSRTSDVFGQINAETRPRQVPGVKSLQYTFSAATTQQSYFGDSAVSLGTLRTQNVGMRLIGAPVPIAHDMTFTQSASLGQTWIRGGTSARQGIAALATSTLRRTVRGAGNRELGAVGLSYDLTQQPQVGQAGTFASINGHHRLGLFTDLWNEQRWNLGLIASQGLDTPQRSIDANIGVRISGPWRLGTRFSASRISGFRFQEVEYSVIRELGGREVALFYSTVARRVQLNISGVGF
jgi:hypothetical protein